MGPDTETRLIVIYSPDSGDPGGPGCQYVTNRVLVVTDVIARLGCSDVSDDNKTQYTSSSGQKVAAMKSISNKSGEQFYEIVGLIYFKL